MTGLKTRKITKRPKKSKIKKSKKKNILHTKIFAFNTIKEYSDPTFIEADVNKWCEDNNIVFSDKSPTTIEYTIEEGMVIVIITYAK